MKTPTFLREELKKQMSSKTDEELYGILHAHSKDYTTDALEVAEEEFRRRNLDTIGLNELSAVAGERQQREQAGLGWPLRILSFFISTLALGIPVLLAHRHFVEQGATRKARQWGRWALFGFVFYLTLFIAGLLLR